MEENTTSANVESVEPTVVDLNGQTRLNFPCSCVSDVFFCFQNCTNPSIQSTEMNQDQRELLRQIVENRTGKGEKRLDPRSAGDLNEERVIFNYYVEKIKISPVVITKKTKFLGFIPVRKKEFSYSIRLRLRISGINHLKPRDMVFITRDDGEYAMFSVLNSWGGMVDLTSLINFTREIELNADSPILRFSSSFSEVCH